MPNKIIDITDAKNATKATKSFAKEAGQVKRFIAQAEKHDAAARKAEISAAEILVRVKAELPHGAYTPWLKANDIAPRTASRLIAEHLDPQKREARKAAKNAKERNERARAKAEKERNKKAAKVRRELTKGKSADDIRTEVLRMVGGLNKEQIADLFVYLTTKYAPAAADETASDETKAA